MAKTWDELKKEGAILPKGERLTKPKPAQEPIKKSNGMRCSNCGGAIYHNAPDRCTCTIWEVGKRKEHNE
jgi:hypothetical protein